ncbi:MAG: hypothetical protein IKG90_01680 [Bacteroidales bacterium]|jgi:ElaB/YqjD/DUF883 family membrane-anchored ribosome-binding protein|nr:hypothetical protein [Bacteroidales bacterium]MBR3064346.1 hypothetical protein [Bacteroidales bacterium]
MCEEKKEECCKDPRDLNGDGKVTLDEKIKYAAGKAGEKMKEVAGEMKENAKNLYDKAAPKAKEVFAEMKENAENLMDKAKDKIDSLKDKKDVPQEPKA